MPQVRTLSVSVPRSLVRTVTASRMPCGFPDDSVSVNNAAPKTRQASTARTRLSPFSALAHCHCLTSDLVNAAKSFEFKDAAAAVAATLKALAVSLAVVDAGVVVAFFTEVSLRRWRGLMRLMRLTALSRATQSCVGLDESSIASISTDVRHSNTIRARIRTLLVIRRPIISKGNRPSPITNIVQSRVYVTNGVGY